MKLISVLVLALLAAGCETAPRRPYASERFLTYRVADKPMMTAEFEHGDYCAIERRNMTKTADVGTATCSDAPLSPPLPAYAVITYPTTTATYGFYDMAFCVTTREGYIKTPKVTATVSECRPSNLR